MSRTATITLIVVAALLVIAGGVVAALLVLGRAAPAAATAPVSGQAVDVRPQTTKAERIGSKGPARLGKAPLDVDEPRPAAAPAAAGDGGTPRTPPGDVDRARATPARRAAPDPAEVHFDRGPTPTPAPAPTRPR